MEDQKKLMTILHETTGLPIDDCNEIIMESGGDDDKISKLLEQKSIEKLKIHPVCPYCSRIIFKQLDNGRYWCSWCNIDFKKGEKSEKNLKLNFSTTDLLSVSREKSSTISGNIKLGRIKQHGNIKQQGNIKQSGKIIQQMTGVLFEGIGYAIIINIILTIIGIVANTNITFLVLFIRMLKFSIIAGVLVSLFNKIDW